MTRAEVAAIFFRLLTDESMTQFMTSSNSFSDVSSAKWYNTAISTLVKAGILTGYQDGKFLPNENITRAEFAVIISRFAALKSGENSFIDISGSWAEKYINSAYTYGWITGYVDNSFKPNREITRAEVMIIVNRILERDVEASDMLDPMAKWSDNAPEAWYYSAIQEATNFHDYERTDKQVPNQSYFYEKWTQIKANND